MNIYIAGLWDARARLCEVRDRVEAAGHKVVGTWLDAENKPAHSEQGVINSGGHDLAKNYAVRDADEVVNLCDMLMLDTLDLNVRGGREVEYGLALASNKRTVVVGPKRNVFHSIAHYHFENWDEAIRWLKWVNEHA